MIKIPFSWLPASWGLAGKTRQIAEAEYYYSGYELDIELAKINSTDVNNLKQLLLSVELKHEKIDKYTYDIESAKISLADDDNAKELAVADTDLKYGKITQLQFEKRRADILKEPWVSMPKISWDPNIKDKTFFELDYNEYFVTFLKENGYVGAEDEIINKWLNDVCISVIEEINDMDAEYIIPSRRLTDNQ